jgi:transposase
VGSNSIGRAGVCSGFTRTGAELKVEVAALREQVNRNSRNASQPPSSDGPSVPPQSSKLATDGKRQRRGHPGHPGTTRKLVPPAQVKDSYDIKPQACRKCAHTLDGQDPEPRRHQVTEISPVVAEIIAYRLHRLTCPDCGSETCTEWPPGVPQGALGPRLQAMYHLSKRDIEEIMDDFFQADISVGAVCALEQRTREASREPVAEARAYVKAQPVVHMDETGWREANKKAWLWMAATSFVTVFLIRCSRGGKVAQEMLGAAILAQSDRMFDRWHRIRDGTMSRAAFQANMASIQQEVGALLRQGITCAHDKTAGTCRGILKREAALWTFVHVEGVEPTNSLGERQVRPDVIWRKMSFGTQSEAGSRFVERITSVVSTLKQQQRNVLYYLTEACDVANWERPAPSLLPTVSTL